MKFFLVVAFILTSGFLNNLQAQRSEQDSLRKIFINEKFPLEERKNAYTRWQKIGKDEEIRLNEEKKNQYSNRKQQAILKTSENLLLEFYSKQDSSMIYLMELIDVDTLADMLEKEKAIELLSKYKDRRSYRFLMEHFDLEILHNSDELIYRDIVCFWYLYKESVDNWLLLPELMLYINDKARSDTDLEYVQILLFNVFQNENRAINYLELYDNVNNENFTTNKIKIKQLFNNRD